MIIDLPDGSTVRLRGRVIVTDDPAPVAHIDRALFAAQTAAVGSAMEIAPTSEERELLLGVWNFCHSVLDEDTPSLAEVAASLARRIDRPLLHRQLRALRAAAERAEPREREALKAVHALTDTLLSYAEEARLSLAPRELCAVLCGLRLLQRFLVEDPTGHTLPDGLDDVYTDGDAFEGLTASEIDVLCVRLNGA